jgi:transcriptional regulator, arsR family
MIYAGDTVSLPDVFKALSDPVRREILLLLKQRRKMSAGEIVAEFELSNATISYHLSILKKADLVFETRYQKYIYYEINTSVFEDAMMWLMQFRGSNDEDE